MRIRYSGTIRAICPPAAFCQQSELGLCPVRRALQRRIQGFLYRWFRMISGRLRQEARCELHAQVYSANDSLVMQGLPEQVSVAASP